jgi:hypothetical protein
MEKPSILFHGLFNFSKLSEEDLKSIIDEVDADGSGTLDFDGEIIFFAALYTKRQTALSTC